MVLSCPRTLCVSVTLDVLVNFGLVRLITERERQGVNARSRKLLLPVRLQFQKPDSDPIIPQLASHELQRHRAKESLDHLFCR